MKKIAVVYYDVTFYEEIPDNVTVMQHCSKKGRIFTGFGEQQKMPVMKFIIRQPEQQISEEVPEEEDE